MGTQYTIGSMSHAWDVGNYRQNYSFVWQSGRELLGLLDPRPGERILDVGCGIGQLTSEIAQAGAEVLGIDLSPAMIAEARATFPVLPFEIQDVRALPFREEFDAVFSNAVLHWVQPAEEAARSIAAALKPGGRFVAEMGGRGNIANVIRAADRAFEALGMGTAPPHPWFYPSVAEYTSILDQAGLETTFAVLFDRPTPLENGAEGLARWYEMFGHHWLDPIVASRRAEFFRLAAEIAAPGLLSEGQWRADYRRLRIAARKP